MDMPPAVQHLDPYLIFWYRLTGVAVVDFLLGTVVLVLLCLLAGKLSSLAVLRLLQPRLAQYGAEAAEYQELAMAALKAGDKEAYRAANKLANEAFGHTFFQQMVLSAAYLWPIFFALAWMQYRFLELELPIPGTPWSLGFIGIFLLLYLGTLFVVKGLGRLTRRLLQSVRGQVPSETIPESPSTS